MNTLQERLDSAHKDVVEEKAREYQERLFHGNQTGLVTHLLSEDSNYLSYEDVTNLTPDVSSMDGDQLAEFIRDYLSEDWRDLIDLDAYTDRGNSTEDVEPDHLLDGELDYLRDYITENHTPGDIYEWHLVDSWLASELEALGHPTLTDGSNHWWGRRTTGQYILMDGVLQQIAAKYI